MPASVSTGDQAFAVLLLCFCVGFAALIVIAYRRRYIPTETVLLTAIMISIALLGGAFGAAGVPLLIESGSATQFSLDPSQSTQSALLCLRAAAAASAFSFLSGIVLSVSGLRRTISTTVTSNVRAESSTGLEVSELLTKRAWTVAFGVVLLFSVTLLSMTWSEILVRPSYMFLSTGTIQGALGYATLPVACVAAILAVGGPAGWLRASSWLMFVLLAIVEFSRASRSGPAMWVAAGVVVILFGQWPRWKKVSLAALLLVVGCVELVGALQLRGTAASYGLIPFADKVFAGQLSFNAAAWQAAFSNLLASVPITYYSSRLSLPAGFLSVSLSPLSGQAAGFYDISQALTLAWAVPSNAVGQVAALPLWAELSTWAIIGLLLQVCSAIRSGMSRRISIPIGWLSATLTAAASIQFLQYSLRAGMRFVWAAVLIHLMAWVIDALMKSTSRKRNVSIGVRRMNRTPPDRRPQRSPSPYIGEVPGMASIGAGSGLSPQHE